MNRNPSCVFIPKNNHTWLFQKERKVKQWEISRTQQSGHASYSLAFSELYFVPDITSWRSPHKLHEVTCGR